MAQTGNQKKLGGQCFCPVGHKGVHYPNCHNHIEPEPIPEWVDICKQLAHIEDLVNKVKQQIMRSATNIDGGV